MKIVTTFEWIMDTLITAIVSDYGCT